MAKQKEIVLLPFSFSNLKEDKVRPAIIVSNDKFNDNSPDCLMIPLTSVIKNKSHSVLIKPRDLISGRLITESEARADKIFPIEQKLIKMNIGNVNEYKFREIIKKIIKIF